MSEQTATKIEDVANGQIWLVDDDRIDGHVKADGETKWDQQIGVVVGVGKKDADLLYMDATSTPHIGPVQSPFKLELNRLIRCFGSVPITYNTIDAEGAPSLEGFSDGCWVSDIVMTDIRVSDDDIARLMALQEISIDKG